MLPGMIMASHMPECHMSTMAQSTSTRQMGMPKARKKNRVPRKMKSSTFSPYALVKEDAGRRMRATRSRTCMIRAAKAMMGNVPLIRAMFTLVPTE